jgi:hypothetical protein
VSEKLKMSPYENGSEIVGNREGLYGVAEVCLALSRPPEAGQTAANHYHFAEYMNTAEAGSVPRIIRFAIDL